MSAKKFTGIRLEPRVQEVLKSLAGELRMSIGDTLEGLLNLYRFLEDVSYIKDSATRELLKGIRETAMANTGERAGAMWLNKKSEEEIKQWLLSGQDEELLTPAAKAELKTALKWLKGEKD